MGGALLEGWLKQGICTKVTISDPMDLPKKFQNNDLIRHIKDVSELNEKHDICVLATKPQIMDKICPALQEKLSDGTPVLSIAAGKSIGYFENFFGAQHPIIRAMPNTPAAIGKGITVAVPNPLVSELQVAQAHALLMAGGDVEWLDDENLMDAVTALSGSGPAYIFYLIETLEKTGQKLGLSPNMSAKLARQTVIGSAALAESDADTPASTLRENVTSPGGTTAAALNVLMDGRLEKIYEEALTAARNRGQELNS